MIGMIISQYWWITIPGILLGIYAQMKLGSTFGKYSKVGNSNQLSGAEAARTILDSAGLRGMEIGISPGRLSDHYDPIKKRLMLSEDNYHGRSIAAVGVAAHEAGHALQHKANYAPMNLRMAVVPITNIASKAYLPLFLIGFFGGMFEKVLPLIIIIFSIICFFQLVTLPVEFDASHRAKKQLESLGLIRGNEGQGVSKVLNAAALTYVAAMVTSALDLLQFILMAQNNDD